MTLQHDHVQEALRFDDDEEIRKKSGKSAARLTLPWLGHAFGGFARAIRRRFTIGW
jgi:hypothetical protein